MWEQSSGSCRLEGTPMLGGSSPGQMEGARVIERKRAAEEAAHPFSLS